MPTKLLSFGPVSVIPIVYYRESLGQFKQFNRIKEVLEKITVIIGSMTYIFMQDISKLILPLHQFNAVTTLK